ncbi:protein scarlet [Sitodiplosis mosellana]|uniref:protein scarlet n=1 Tax=Sitodiplosis mosellana TaxID=263140 RepID=UPI002444ED52|nr:protein scarlet [Sitodiplosis mosellana]XP_055300851.1 protein scarlet [Sitodiplosis mosellana]
MGEYSEITEMDDIQCTKPCSGATLIWRNVNVYTKDKKNGRGKMNLKQIINNSTGFIQPGTLMAVMGSSGAGKTTLFSALAFRNMAGTVVKGEILVNNRPVGPFMHRLSGFVHQEDIFDGTLTVLEHMTFIANLKLDKRISRQKKSSLVNSTLGRVGLLHCVNTRIGDTDKGKALSGGEKKRLSFAAELLTNPVLLFCDEPTTGLDAYSAQQLVSILVRLTKQGTTIMCTIHQPSSQIFSMFHKLLLLADGRVSFIGTPDGAISFFSLNGYQCPAAFNPADFLIGVLSKTEPGQEPNNIAHQLCDAFEASRKDQVNERPNGFVIDEDNKQYEIQKPLWIFTVYWLIYRNFLIVARDPSIQKLRIVQKIAIAIMAGLCFYGSVSLDQYGIQSVQGALFILISENTFAPMYSALSLFPRRDPLFIRERQAGLYNTLQYYITNVAALIPSLIVEPFIFTIILYFLAELRPTFYAIFITSIVTIIVMNVATACGCFFSIAFNSVDMAIGFLVPFDVSLMITSGVFIKLNSIPYPLNVIKYVSWMKYANEAMTIVQWEGVTNITCNFEAQLPCIGSAEEIYSQFDFTEDDFYTDFYALAALYLAFNILAFLLLWLRVRKH